MEKLNRMGLVRHVICSIRIIRYTAEDVAFL